MLIVDNAVEVVEEIALMLLDDFPPTLSLVLVTCPPPERLNATAPIADARITIAATARIRRTMAERASDMLIVLPE